MKEYSFTLFVVVSILLSCSSPDKSKEVVGFPDPDDPGIIILPNDLVLRLDSLNADLVNDSCINKILIAPMFFNANTGLIKVFSIQRLNPSEKKYVKEHKINSVKGGMCAIGAELRSSNSGFGGRVGGKQDAVRHAFWAACMTKMLGRTVAEEILANHEMGVNSDKTPDAQDVANNKFGVDLGESMHDKSFSEIWAAILEAANNGKLVIPTPTPPIIFPPFDPTPITKPTPIQKPETRSGKGNENNNQPGDRHPQIERPKIEHKSDPNDGIANPSDRVPDKPKVDKPRKPEPIKVERPTMG